MSEDGRIVAVRCGSVADAEAALAELGALPLVDAVVVAKQTGDRVELRQTHATSIGEGAVAGGTLGLLAGLMLGAPVGAAVAGVLAGGGLSLRDTGIPDDRLRRLASDLLPGRALLVVLVHADDVGRARELLEPYGEVVEDGEDEP